MLVENVLAMVNLGEGRLGIQGEESEKDVVGNQTFGGRVAECGVFSKVTDA